MSEPAVPVVDEPVGGPVTGEDGVPRCPWASRPGPMRDYHDTEWGLRVPGAGRERERAYFERLTLEAFQSGLSWATILAKREAFREVFAGFDADAVAGFEDERRGLLLTETRIVRNRAKIDATCANAAAVVALRDDGPDALADLLESFAPVEQPAPATVAETPTLSAESTALSRALKRRGFRFVGPTTMHALMEATGIVDTHLLGCHRRDARLGVEG